MAEQIPADLAESTLAADITSGAGSLTINAPTFPFPSSGDFRIAISTSGVVELIKVTAIAGNVLTLGTRGDGGTTAAAHLAGDVVAVVWTKEGLDKIRQETILSSTYAGILTAGQAGRLNLLTNAPFLGRDNGSSIDYFGGRLWSATPFPSGGFTWNNQSTATLDTTHGFEYISKLGAGADNIVQRYRSIPATPCSALVRIIPDIHPTNFTMAGLHFRESATDKIATLYLAYDTTGTFLRVYSYTNHTTFSAQKATLALVDIGVQPVEWLQLRYDGTNCGFWWGHDPYNLRELYTVAKTTLFTTAPDQWGYSANSTTAAQAAGASLLSWVEGS